MQTEQCSNTQPHEHHWYSSRNWYTEDRYCPGVVKAQATAWDQLPDGSRVPCAPTNQQVALSGDIYHCVEVPC